MTQEVWVSSVMTEGGIGNKQGIREKYYGEDWAPPTFILGVPPEHVIAATDRHYRGHALTREEFTEAMYVFDEKRWARQKDLFMAGGFYAVRGKLAEVLKQFDLGAGGLIEFPIYQADKVTPLPGPFYLLNFGCIKDSVVIEQCQKLHHVFEKKIFGYDQWSVSNLEDGEIAVTAAALEGPDLWFESKLRKKILMSGRLHDAIVAEKIKVNFKFARARIE
ncbi:hypothetical protein [Thioclava indica]|uniref:Uncharacterized protein n=1 Tax=Thioclava indica TaxID=1353528 RepID=A0A074JUE4_9RHOB|nr:hypothetical protein [Thioclava indica]KEO59248.1 hypothetical protein DT23_04005 [Thioclava indica]